MSGSLKVLIAGANGQLGRALQRSAPDGISISALNRAELDVSDMLSVRAGMSSVQPDVIINAAAYTAVDNAESETDPAQLINVTGPHNLARAASESKSRLIQVSTDFVFDGNASRPYPVDAACNPLSVYGKTKYHGERAVHDTLGPRAVIVRTSWLYDATGKNFVTTMLRLMKERGAVRVVSDQIGTPTSTLSLAAMIWRCVANQNISGTYHWSDAGVASWYDFAVAIAEEARAIGILQRDVSVTPIATSDYPIPAKRPAYSVLDKSKSYADLNLTPVHWREELRRVLVQDNETKMSA